MFSPHKQTSLSLRKLGLWISASLTALLFLVIPGILGLAAGPIVLDSLFSDWAGQPCQTDPLGDASNGNYDLLNFCYATNAGDPTAYFMAERSPSENKLGLVLLLDTNNDGDFNDGGDRLVGVRYKPRNNNSRVKGWVFDGTGGSKTRVFNNRDWGESKREGWARVEWGIAFSDLGISPGQTIQMRRVGLDEKDVDDINRLCRNTNTCGDEILSQALDTLPDQTNLNWTLPQIATPTPTATPTVSPPPQSQCSTNGPASPIVMDSEFADWVGKANIPDPVGDANTNATDLSTFYFGSNYSTDPNDSNAYFMTERAFPSNRKLNLVLLVDTNNNGIFDDAVDRLVEVEYKPKRHDSEVTVWVYDLSDPTGGTRTRIYRKEDWGESRMQGGQCVEWKVSFVDDLGVVFGSAIRMILVSLDNTTEDVQELCDNTPNCSVVTELLSRYSDRIPDTGDIQWSTANALGLPIVLTIAVIGAGWLAYRRRKEP